MIYVLQVKALEEEKVFKRLLKKGYIAYLPRQDKFQRKDGKWTLKTMLLFSGYVFVETNMEVQEYNEIKSISGVIKFLNSAGSNKPQPLSVNESEFIKYLANGNEILKPIYVSFENSILKIIDNEFKHYESKIIKVDRRQKRIKVFLKIGTGTHTVTLYINEVN